VRAGSGARCSRSGAIVVRSKDTITATAREAQGELDLSREEIEQLIKVSWRRHARRGVGHRVVTDLRLHS
jgi:hypothetical protein